MMEDYSRNSQELTSTGSEKIAAKGFLVFREGRRIAKRNGNQIDLFYLDGRLDKSEPVSTVQKGNTIEIYDVAGNQIGVEQIEGVPAE